MHPGETPGSFVFNGFLDFILREDDQRAKQLRKNYVFKLIPMLNPDGVQQGHYRTDTRGVNLNRIYLDPSPDLYPTIYAAKSVLVFHHSNNRSWSSKVGPTTTSKDGIVSSTNVKLEQVSSPPDDDAMAQVSFSTDLALNSGPKSVVDTSMPLHCSSLSSYLRSSSFPSVDAAPCNKATTESNEAISVPNEVTAECIEVTNAELDGRKMRLTTVDDLSECVENLTCEGGDHRVPWHKKRDSLQLDVYSGGECEDFEDTYAARRRASWNELSPRAKPHIGNEGSDDDVVDHTPITKGIYAPHLADPKLLEISATDSGVAFYVDLHGHASKRGCFMYGNYFEDEELQTENLMYPRLLALNSAHFDLNACNFTERNMYTADKRDGFSKEGSGRVAIFKALGIIHR